MILHMLENGAVVKTKEPLSHFERECDVLVVGAGSAGCYAADSAARLGARVILCEISENIGGMSVIGGVTTHYYGSPGGSFEEDEGKIREDTVFHTNKMHWEQRQIHLVKRLTESGVEILCRHSVIGLLIDGKNVVGARVFDGKRCFDIKAHITVDATSDGHLMRLTDVKKSYGRESDGGFVPFTVRAHYVKEGKLAAYNKDSGLVNHYDKFEFSKKVIMARANAAKLLKNDEFVNFALQTGVREGLTFEGEDTLCYEDVLLGKRSDRVLFWAYSDFDRHGSERASEDELFQNWFVISNLSTVMVGIPVPIGAVVPKGVGGLVSAGRCLSVDTYLQSAVRMNRDMFRMGECVGALAALAAKNNVGFLDVDYGEYLSVVSERGCFGKKDRMGFYFDNSYKWYSDKMKSLGRPVDPKYPVGKAIRERLDFDLEKNLHLLKTDAPGVAIWSAFISDERKKVSEILFECLVTAESELYRYNSAIALGILGDACALQPLREIVERRDCFFFTDNRRSNQFRSVVAICLLGRLGTRDELPLLFDVLSRDESEREMYHTLEPNYLYGTDTLRNTLYFQILTHATEAIIKISKRCGISAKELREKFSDVFSDGYILRRITSAPVGTPQYDETAGFIERIKNVNY